MPRPSSVVGDSADGKATITRGPVRILVANARAATSRGGSCPDKIAR